MFRTEGDGKVVEMNQNLTFEQKMERQEKSWNSYFRAMKDMLNGFNNGYAFSIHSFTDCYEGEKRELEVGILCLNSDDLAIWLRDKFLEKGIKAEINKPYNTFNSESQ